MSFLTFGADKSIDESDGMDIGSGGGELSKVLNVAQTRNVLASFSAKKSSNNSHKFAKNNNEPKTK